MVLAIYRLFVFGFTKLKTLSQNVELLRRKIRKYRILDILVAYINWIGPSPALRVQILSRTTIQLIPLIVFIDTDNYLFITNEQ